MPVDGASARGEVARLVRERPLQATTLCLERYLRIPPKALGAEVLDQLLAGEGTGPSANARPGRAVRWRDAAGRDLAAIDVHPVGPDFEDAILPIAFAVLADAPLGLELRCDSQTLLDGRAVVERWDGRDLLGQSVLGAPGPGAPAAEFPTPAERVLLAKLEGLGCRVAVEAGAATGPSGQVGTAIVVSREQVSRAQPWILAFLPLLLWAVPVLLLFARGVLWSYLDRALKTRRYRLQLRFEPRRVTARYEGDGVQAEAVEIAAGDVAAVSFAPRGCVTGPRVIGALRVVGREAVAHVPAHLPDLAPGTQQELGRALKGLLQAAALRARAPGPPAP